MVHIEKIYCDRCKKESDWSVVITSMIIGQSYEQVEICNNCVNELKIFLRQ